MIFLTFPCPCHPSVAYRHFAFHLASFHQPSFLVAACLADTWLSTSKATHINSSRCHTAHRGRSHRGTTTVFEHEHSTKSTKVSVSCGNFVGCLFFFRWCSSFFQFFQSLVCSAEGLDNEGHDKVLVSIEPSKFDDNIWTDVSKTCVQSSTETFLF